MTHLRACRVSSGWAGTTAARAYPGETAVCGVRASGWRMANSRDEVCCPRCLALTACDPRPFDADADRAAEACELSALDLAARTL